MQIGNPGLWVWMDISATCNLACRDCFTRQSHEAYVMSPIQFRTILQKLADAPVSLRRILLNWRAEPLTNKKLVEFLRIRQEILPDVSLIFHTNGLLLTPQISSDIITEAMEGDLFYISIDGGNREAHEANRGEGTWSRTLKGLKIFLDARNKREDGAPRIGIYEISYGTHTVYDSELVSLSKYCDEWVRVPLVRSSGSEESYDIGSVPDAPCFWAGHAFCITARGDVHVCLLSFRPDGRIGNLLTENLQPILERARNFRTEILEKGRSHIPHCQNCRKISGEADDHH